MGNARNVKNGIVVCQCVEAGVIAERTFRPQFVEFHVTFQHNLRVRRHFEVDSLALDQLDSLLAQETRDHELFDLGRCGHDCGEGQRRIGADRHRDLHLSRRTITLGEHAATG